MKVIILVGGFGTRIESVAKGRAKTLLPIYVDGKYQPIFYFLLDKINRANKVINDIDEAVVITNDKYYIQMISACDQYKLNNIDNSIPIRVISDHSTCNENRLGANGDLQFANDRLGETDDVLILAGDNYFDFELSDFIKFYQQKKEIDANPTVIAAKQFEEEKKEYVHKSFAIVELDKTGKVTEMVEKPALIGKEMNSNLGAIALYVMTRKNFNLIDEYLKSCADNPKGRDAMGHFAGYLSKNTATYSFTFDGEFIDIGTVEEYNKLQKPDVELKV